MEPIRVGILGATGTVGVELIRMLDGHPWFVVAEAGGSSRSAGKTLGEVAAESGSEIPLGAKDLLLKDVRGDWTSPLLLSALPRSAAVDLEPELAERGHVVVTNASAHRMGSSVPLVIPELNAAHFALLDQQPWSGALIANPNCAVAVCALALAPLNHAAGIRDVVATTFQAISGAGRPGPSASALVDNVVPWISGEEEKLREEPQKILGTLNGGSIQSAPFAVAATCTRVPVLHGHLVSMTVTLAKPLDAEDAERIFREGAGIRARPDLPSSPAHPLVVRPEPDRPQPRLDRDAGDRMSVTVGRVRESGASRVSFLALGHNLGRGAAGAALQNAELAVQEGVVGG